MPVILHCGECPLAQRARTLGWPAAYCPLFLPSILDLEKGLRLVVSRRLGIAVVDSPPDPRGHPIRLLLDGPVRCPSLIPRGAEPGQVASSRSSYVSWLVRRKLPWLFEAEQEDLVQDVFLDLSRTAARTPRGEEVLNIARLAVHSRARERFDRRECRSCIHAHRQDEGNPQTDPLVCGMTAWPDGRSLLVRGSLRPPVESWCLRMDGERVPYDPVTMSSLRCDRCLDAIPRDWSQVAPPAAKGSRAGSAPVRECRSETGVYRGRIVSAELRESAMGCGSFQIVEDSEVPVTIPHDRVQGRDYRGLVRLLRDVESRLADRFDRERAPIDEMEAAGRAYGFEPRFRPEAARLCFRYLFVSLLESASGAPGPDDLAGALVALGVHVAPVREDLTASWLRRSAGTRRMPRPLLPEPRPWEGQLPEIPGELDYQDAGWPWSPLLGWLADPDSVAGRTDALAVVRAGWGRAETNLSWWNRVSAEACTAVERATAGRNAPPGDWIPFDSRVGRPSFRRAYEAIWGDPDNGRRISDCLQAVIGELRMHPRSRDGRPGSKPPPETGGDMSRTAGDERATGAREAPGGTGEASQEAGSWTLDALSEILDGGHVTFDRHPEPSVLSTARGHAAAERADEEDRALAHLVFCGQCRARLDAETWARDAPVLQAVFRRVKGAIEVTIEALSDSLRFDSPGLAMAFRSAIGEAPGDPEAGSDRAVLKPGEEVRVVRTAGAAGERAKVTVRERGGQVALSWSGLTLSPRDIEGAVRQVPGGVCVDALREGEEARVRLGPIREIP